MNLPNVLKTDCKNICIVLHRKPDGDAICSAKAIHLLYKKCEPDKNVFLINDRGDKIKIKFPKTNTDLPNGITGEEIPEDTFLLLLDHSDFYFSLLRKDYGMSPNIKQKLIIDHHICYNELLSEKEKYVKLEAYSTCEIIFDLVKAEESLSFDEELALALYLGIFSDSAYHKSPLKIPLIRKILELANYCEHLVEKFQYYEKGDLYAQKKQLAYYGRHCVSKEAKSPVAIIHMTFAAFDKLEKNFLTLSEVLRDVLSARKIEHVLCSYEYEEGKWGITLRSSVKNVINKYVPRPKHPYCFSKIGMRKGECIELRDQLEKALKNEKTNYKELEEESKKVC